MRKKPCPLTNEWIMKMWYLCTMEYYTAIKKNKIMPFVETWLDLEIIILNKSDRERHISCDTAYILNLKNETDQLIYKIEIVIHVENKHIVTRGGRG